MISNKLSQLLFLLLLPFVVFSQNELPYKWSGTTKSLGDGIYELQYTCKVDSAWHIYSINSPAEGGFSTKIKVIPSSAIELQGKITEPAPIKKFEELFGTELWYHEGNVTFSQKIKIKGSAAVIVNAEIESQACQNDGVCTRPEIEKINLSIQPEPATSESVFWVFWAGLLAGFVALLTPCVFPMIPMTVTFFTKQAESKKGGVFKAFVYGVSIVVIYVSLGLGITILLGEEALNKMASSAVFNILFFVLLLVFAISFLGAFEITLPAKFVNKIDSKADKGGWIGLFFMAFALALVSFSCTGPLIGTLLVEAAVNGGIKGPFLGMLGFGTALAFPFTLFALFPNWLKSLPKSGSWLNSVKVVLGLLELALALKFLSNADLVYQTGYLTREVFIAIWIVIFLITGLYLLGKIKFAHDSELKYLSVGRSFLAMLFFSLVVYLIPGMWGAPLKLLSGVLPPTFYNEGWQLSSPNDKGMGQIVHENCPNGLSCFHDYDLALTEAKKTNKPLLIDFTGWTCVNCRYMEQNIWSAPEIDAMIREKFVLVSLYVDSRKEIPVDQQYISPRNGKKITTYGEKWADLEIAKFGEITQPLYVVLNHQEEEIAPKQSYTTSIEKYKSFLQQGLDNFNQKVAK